MGSLFTAKWGGTSDRMLLPQGCIGTIITKKNHQGILRNPQGVEVIEHVTERLIHSFDQCSKRFRVIGFIRICIVLLKARIGIEGSMHSIVGKIKIKRLTFLDGFGHCFFGLQR